MAEKKEVDTKPEVNKAKKFYFKNTTYAGLTVQVQKKVKQATPYGEQEVQEVAEEASFVQYYDTFKGDTVRVGYLVTESEAIANRCREDFSCEEINEVEYTQAVVGDAKHKPLQKAPVPAT